MKTTPLIKLVSDLSSTNERSRAAIFASETDSVSISSQTAATWEQNTKTTAGYDSLHLSVNTAKSAYRDEPDKLVGLSVFLPTRFGRKSSVLGLVLCGPRVCLVPTFIDDFVHGIKGVFRRKEACLNGCTSSRGMHKCQEGAGHSCMSTTEHDLERARFLMKEYERSLPGGRSALKSRVLMLKSYLFNFLES